MYKNEVLSIVAGYVSIASWIVVLFPQIWTNFKRKSSDSLSLTFLYIWAVGDLLNLTGAILQHLLKTMILLAVYYIFTDIVIISQVYYYRRRSVDETVYSTVGETTPLISNNNSNNSTPESRRQARIKQFLYLFLSLIGVCLTGVVAYVISSDKSHEAVNLRALNDSDEEMKLLPQIFGWASAILYLGSRIPQILQNYKNKSTEGLALAMFCFSVLGNISYSLSVIFHSTDPKYLLVNLAWLIGSGGTLVFDFVIFAQFYIYRNNSYVKPNSTTHNQTTGNV